MKRIRGLVTGKVQGVCYRASTRDKALDLNLSGWVRNLPNGNVEFEAEGSTEDVDALVMWAWKGPIAAQVDHVGIQVIEPQHEHGFVISH